MTAPLVFMDTETTGLGLDDDIWEFAAIRREIDGSENELHLFIEHSTYRCDSLPESFRADHLNRFPVYHGDQLPDSVKSQRQAAELIRDLFRDGRPHVVGAVPNFDTERIAKMCLDQRVDAPAWHYHLIDVENLAVGYLMGAAPGVAGKRRREIAAPPWNSDAIAAALGVTISEADRHTAMGDTRWAMRIYDVVMGASS